MSETFQKSQLSEFFDVSSGCIVITMQEIVHAIIYVIARVEQIAGVTGPLNILHSSKIVFLFLSGEAWVSQSPSEKG